ncbi:MAG: amidohydrolase family protein, partial [bacterium]|nr:amidohydrolase family protein [bacterium]
SPPNPKTLRPNIDAFEHLLAHNRKASIIWSHAGWDNTGGRTIELMRELLRRHPNLYMSIRVVPIQDRPARQASSPVDSSGRIRPEWRRLLEEFPDRFMLGSDEFFLSPRMSRKWHPSTGSTRQTFSLCAGLAPDLARRVGSENATRLFKLDERSH